jgi:glycosyltransferase involved in cell wall biosynthesis
MNKTKLTVVIASLGGPQLEKTLSSINSGSVLPDEIIVCIPITYFKSASIFTMPNIKVKLCDKSGQVYQRSEGFKLATGEFVMQLDDDIILEHHCIEILLRKLKLLPIKTALSPSLYNFQNKSIFHKSRSSFYYWLINGKKGYKAGSIYLSGSPEGPSINTKKTLIQSEWLPGGCVIHRRSNLILNNFFPFSGKAFCEDLIHSTLLRKRNIRLFFATDAIAYLEMASYTEYKLETFIKSLALDYQARKFLIKLLNIKSKRIYIFYLIITLNYFYFFFLKLMTKKK